ncbi:MAG: ZIP family metal transporter [Deltaproteobacteria bacterium]|nr:ZIP family metal transporter [Deltaproteobacteria bacterium]MBI4373667.1 ZIP family metal transporter [Deltaproteobacteria bacterium]
MTNLSLYSVVLSLSVVVGGVIPLLFSFFRKHLPIFLSFSAGVMLGTTLIHLVPEAIELIGKEASFWILIGFLFLYAFERFVTVHICEALECEVHSLGIAAVVGISAHALTDGIALGSSLLVSRLGIVILIAIFFHKLPEAFALTSILLHERKGRSHILFFNLFLILMVPLGGLIVYWLVGSGFPQLTGYALSFSAGTFLHIAISDLLPEIHRYSDRRTTLFVSFFLGLVWMYLLGRVLHPMG